MTRSLRFRLLLHTSLTTAMVLALLGIAVYFSVRRSLLSQFDSSLMAKAIALSAMAEQHDDRVRFEFDPELMPEFGSKSKHAYCEVWNSKQRVIFRSASLDDQDLIDPPLVREAKFHDMQLPDGKPGRLLTLWMTPFIEEHDRRSFETEWIRLAVAMGKSDINETLARIRWLVSGLSIAAIFLSGLALTGAVSRAIKPVQHLASNIEGLQESNLSNRLAGEGVPTELRPVVDKLNDLLARLSVSFAREKSFTSDVAHELRTPLAGLQTTLDVCRSRPRNATGYEAALDKCRLMTGQMLGMVETLLLLARSENGQLRVEHQPIDLCLTIEECWPLFCDRAEKRGLQVQWEMPKTCEIQTDVEKLRIVIHNLLDNAVSFADENGTLRLGIVSDPAAGRVSVVVANTGNRITSEDIPRIFDRFWRGDQSRTDTGNHCGLGLSLCQRLLRLMHGQITIQCPPDGWFIATASIPADLRAHS